MAEKIPNGVVTSKADRRKTTRLEIWFTAPEVYLPTQLSRHKMVIVLVIVMFCMLNILAPVFATLLSGLHPLVRSLIVIVKRVSLMTPILSW
jgi:antibiotic biosynthesis monooxygenase (ABM) superfamily enzyme